MYRGFRGELNGLCPTCGDHCYRDSDRSDVTIVVCSTCGKFLFGSGVEHFFDDPQVQKGLYKLSHFFRSISERAVGKRDNSFFPIYTDEELVKVIERRDPSVREKIRLLLRYLAGLSEFPGHQISFDSAHDYPVLGGKNVEEGLFYMHALEDRGLISAVWLLSAVVSCTLTPRGWEDSERISR